MQPDTSFVEQVRDALDHLYDFPYLQMHPLADQVLPAEERDPRERMRGLRTAILQAIEELNPGADVPFRSLRARAYSVLNLRYVEGVTVEEAARELAVSERQLYRDLRKAEESLALLLWSRRRPAQGQAPETAGEPARGALVRGEVERLGSETCQVCIQALAEGAQLAVSRLGEQYGVQVRIEAPLEPIVVETDRLLARQALVNALSGAVQSAQPGTLVLLTADRLDSGARIRISYTRHAGPAGSEATPIAAEQLVRSLGGEWSMEVSPGGPSTMLMILGRVPRTTVLVIDDNEGLLELFRRYLADQGYQLLGARDGEEGLRLAEESRPEVIILDVMMPQNDGWEVLQWMKSRERTRHIPVIVCSVLDDPQLALSLGASGFLAKPVNRAQLLAALTGCLQGTRAQARRAGPAGD